MARFRPIDQNTPGASSAEREMGIQFIQGDAGDITSREAGLMVKRMVQYAEKNLKQ